MTIQIWPNHADHVSYYKTKYLEEMFEHEHVIAQPKYDGERLLMHFDGNNRYCTTRRISKKTKQYNEVQDCLPFVNEVKLDGLGYTVLDGEIYSTDWSAIVGVLHSLPDRAKELLKTTIVKYACFDCLYFDGQDIREWPYLLRLQKAKEVIERLNDERFKVVPCIEIDSLDMMYYVRDSYIDDNWEGIVVKSLDRAYYDKGASLKCKKFETIDCVVYDYQQGRGKYEGTVGALLIGYYDEKTDSIVHISKVNCGTDADRDYWRDNWSTLQNTVLEVKCQEITNKSLRHPVYVRQRPDKSYKMCTKDTIFKDE